EEIAKLRAARRMWARFMKERYGAKKVESMRLRTHTQTAGVSATAQQPLNNVARVAIQALAAVLGGAQSLHTNSYDETWALPADDSYRYQQMDDRGQKVTVGVNKYVMKEEKPIHYHRIDESVETEQIERVGRFKAARDMSRVERRLKQLADACRNGGNVMPILVDAVKDYASLGEMSDVYRQVFGLYREPIIF